MCTSSISKYLTQIKTQFYIIYEKFFSFHECRISNYSSRFRNSSFRKSIFIINKTLKFLRCPNSPCHGKHCPSKKLSGRTNISRKSCPPRKTVPSYTSNKLFDGMQCSLPRFGLKNRFPFSKQKNRFSCSKNRTLKTNAYCV